MFSFGTNSTNEKQIDDLKMSKFKFALIFYLYPRIIHAK